MLRKTIVNLLREREEPESGEPHEFTREQVAAAALMVECARADAQRNADELPAICAAVRDHFGLDSETSEQLVAVAEATTQEVWHNFVFLDAIKRGFEPEERLKIVEILWDVAWADGEVQAGQERMIRYAADHLGIARLAVSQAGEAARQRSLDAEASKSRGT